MALVAKVAVNIGEVPPPELEQSKSGRFPSYWLSFAAIFLPFSLHITAETRRVIHGGQRKERRWWCHHDTPRRSTRAGEAVPGAVEWHRGGAHFSLSL